MRAVFGAVVLLVALAIVGLLAVRQLHATGHATSAAAASAAAVAGLPPPAATGNVAEQSKQIQQQVTDDVAKAMAQGAARTRDAADAP